MRFNKAQNLTMGNKIFVPFKMKIMFPFSSYEIAILRLQITQKCDVLHRKRILLLYKVKPGHKLKLHLWRISSHDFCKTLVRHDLRIIANLQFV